MRDFERPGRSVVVARHGMAATSHPLSSLAAVDALRAGGTAMDAAVAACAVQCVVEPGSTGLGGDCFALYAPRGGEGVVAYNGSGRTPLAATAAWYREAGIRAIERNSAHAVTVPGAVEAWSRLVADHGRLGLAAALRPAIALARDGYGVSPRMCHDWAGQATILARDPAARAVFLSGGTVPPVGAVHRQPALADTMQAIAESGPRAFYEGRIAREMVETLRARGGLHTEADFAAARGEVVPTLSTTYRDRRIVECSGNGQGVIALMILNILKRFEPGDDPLAVDRLHVEVEATRLAYAVRDRYLADHGGGDGASRVPVEWMLSDALADELAARIDLRQAIEPLPALHAPEHTDTVYIAVVDAERNCASFINSIFHPFGSGIMAPESGVLFHSRGASFVLDPDHPNTVAPGKRPLHTIIPGMMLEGGRVRMPFGVMGGHYQAMGHAHLVCKVLDFGLDLQTAIDLPRLFPRPESGGVEIEGALRATVGEALVRRGFRVEVPASPIGGAQAVAIDWEAGTLTGASDPRKDGCALGY